MPEEIVPGVYRADATGLSYSMSVLLVYRNDGCLLVDTGLQSSAMRIQQALSALGAGPADLRSIYLTHHHLDHIGGLQTMREWATEAEVVISEHEAQVLSGERTPDPSSNAFWRFLDRKQQPPTAVVDRVVCEGDIFANFRVIAAPGHTR